MMMNNETIQRGYLDMQFSPLWDYVPFIRKYIHDILTLYFENSKDIEKITLTASELLENAVKYSKKEGIRMVLQNMNAEQPVELKVYNFAQPDHGCNLFKVLQDMKEVEPLEYYIRKMRQSVDRESGQANIGLARIYYEGEATVSAQYVQEELVEVNALFASLRGKNGHA